MGQPATPWSGVILCAAAIDRKDLDWLVRINDVPAPVRWVNETSIEYADGPAAVRVRLINPGDPWVRSIDPTLYRKWVDELGTAPAGLAVLTADKFSFLSEPLLMWVAWQIQQRHGKDAPTVAWDFQVREFAPVTFIDWEHEVNVAMGREQRWGPDNPRPEDMTEEQFAERWKHLDEPKKKRFWRRGLLSFELIQTQAARRTSGLCGGHGPNRTESLGHNGVVRRQL